MVIRVWCSTLDKHEEPVTIAVDVKALGDSGQCTVDDLRLRILYDPPAEFQTVWDIDSRGYDSHNIKGCVHVHVYANTSAETRMLPDESLAGHGQHQHDSLRIEPFNDMDKTFCRFRRCAFDPTILRPRLKLLRRLFDMVCKSQFTLAHTGKTALRSLIRCSSRTRTVASSTGSTWHATPWHHLHIRWREDLALTWRPSDAVPELLGQKSVPRMRPADSLLCDKEAKHELLHTAGKLFNTQAMLRDITVRECNGNWSLLDPCANELRCSVEGVGVGMLLADGTPKERVEHEAVLLMLSPNKAQRWMYRVELMPARALLLRCLGNAPNPTQLTNADDYEKACAKLVDDGILEPCGPSGVHVRLLDPLREKEVLRRLFPVRAFFLPTSLDAVIDQAIAHIKAAADNASGLVSLDATTIRARLLEGLMLATDDECCVSPELARVFPEAGEAICPTWQQFECTDIYIGGRVQWGIRLRVRLAPPDPEVSSECLHPEPFSTRGRYGVLEVREHRTVVVEVGIGGVAGVRVVPQSTVTRQPTDAVALIASVEEFTKGSSDNKADELPAKMAKPKIARYARLGEPRTDLVERLRSLLFDMKSPHRLVSLTGPHSIGKSGLLSLFECQLDRDDVDYAWHEVDYTRVPEGVDPLSPVVFAMRRDARIDLMERLVDLQPATPSTAIHSWLPSNVRIIVAATTFPTTTELPPMLTEFPRIQQDAFALSDDRARVFLTTDNNGPDNEAPWSRGHLARWPFKTDALAEVLVRASKGSLGLLDRLAEKILFDGRAARRRSESALVRSFFSKTMSTRMINVLQLKSKATGFTGSYWEQRILPYTSVSRCFALAAQRTSLASALLDPTIHELLALGLVTLTPESTSEPARHRVELTSPSAKRLALTFASNGPKELKPMPLPATPRLLVTSILKMIPTPASASTSDSDGAAVTRFFEQFIEALARRRNYKSEIYPELQDVLYIPAHSQ